MPEPTQEAPRRLRAGDVIENQQAIIEQLLTRSPGEPYVTVEFTRNAKGDTQISTKVSAPMGAGEGELALLGQRVYAQAHQIYTQACNAFPGTPADPDVEAAKADKAKTAAIAANVAKRANGET